MTEARIRQCFYIVLDADPFSIFCNVEIAEGKIDALEERPDESDKKAGKGGQYKYGEPTLDWAAD